MQVHEHVFRVERKKQTEPYTMAQKHFHGHYEIYYLVSGERIYLLEDRICHVHQGDLVLIPKRSIHMTTDAGTDSHERYVVYFKDEFLFDIMPQAKVSALTRHLSDDAKVVSLRASDQDFVERLLAKLLYEEQNPLSHRKLY